MSEISLFLQNAWRLLRKSRLLWFFGGLSSVGPFISFQRAQNDPLSALISLLVSAGMLILSFMSLTGMSYVCYCVATGVTTGIAETWKAIKKFIGRTLGVSCVLALIVSPCLCSFVVIARSTSTDTSAILNAVAISGYVLTVLTPVWAFAYAGVIVKDFGVRKSLKNGLGIFRHHFWTLMGMGIFFTLITWSANLFAVVGILLVQANFDPRVLNGVNYIYPGIALINTPFRVVSGVIQLVWLPLNTMAFMLAFLKYSGIKAVGLAKVF